MLFLRTRVPSLGLRSGDSQATVTPAPEESELSGLCGHLSSHACTPHSHWHTYTHK